VSEVGNSLEAHGKLEARGRLGRDLIAGVTVALVLIPQALAYAELAGVPRERGLFAAAVAPIAASFFASSRYLQTGPVALTGLLTLGALLPLAAVGSTEYAGLAVLLALIVGVTRALLGLFRAGWISYLMSQPVMVGFTTAAGVLIVASQLPAAFGVDPESTGVLGGAVESLMAPAGWSSWALGVTGLTIAWIVGLRRVNPRIPGVLVATLTGLTVGALGAYPGEMLGLLPTGLPPLASNLPWDRLPTLILPGLVIAIVGFAEVAAIARLYASKERRVWDPDREFVGQGAANIASALASGFPVGGSFSRSALNELAGAASKWSGLVAGLVVLGFLPFVGLLAPLPVAVLAGIVIASVFSLLDFRELVRTWVESRPQALIGWSTFVLTLAFAPRIERAVVAGVLLSLTVHIFRERVMQIEVGSDGGVLKLAPRGALWFGTAPRLERVALEQMAAHPDTNRLVVDAGGLGRIDLTGAHVIARVVAEARSAGMTAAVEGVPPQAAGLMERVMHFHGSVESHTDDPAGVPDST
jgi:SulP family sulfate permease